MTNINEIDLNLLRLFDAVYRSRSVSRAADELQLSQPATSQALNRLRQHLRDPLFRRVAGGMQPTARAERLARTIQVGLGLLEAGLNEDDAFDPSTSEEEVNFHLTDIDEARFLPGIMTALSARAPNIQVRSRAWAHDQIADALDNGELHFAIGHLPAVSDTASLQLLTDRYNVFIRADHPIAARAEHGALDERTLSELEFVAVRSDGETTRILQMLRLEPRVRLVASNFLTLPSIIRATDLAALVPRDSGLAFEPRGAFAVLEPSLPQQDFRVALHWSRRHAQSPMMRWLRETILEPFGRRQNAG